MGECISALLVLFIFSAGMGEGSGHAPESPPQVSINQRSVGSNMNLGYASDGHDGENGRPISRQPS